MESVKQMIEKRAYHLFLKRNGAHGYHMQDWVQAEKEIRAELEAGKKAETKSASAAKTAPAPAPAPKATAPTPAAAPAVKPKAVVKGNKKR